MKNILFAAAGAVALFADSALAGDVGIRTIRVPAEHRDWAFETLIWYPAADAGTLEKIGDNPLFEGVAALRDANIARGRFPLVVLSHGSGGNAANLAWLATSLAAEGYMVAAPNHPGTSSGNSYASETVRIWNRPADLSAVLTRLTKDPRIADHIDESRVGLAGFSLGGQAVLSAAGIRVSAADYARHCDTNTERLSECNWFARHGIDLHRLDEARFEQSNKDPRFKFAIAFDPAMVAAYELASLQAMKEPVLLVNFGRGGAIPRGVDASEIARHIPGAEYRTIADAVHFSFLGVCKPAAKEILAEEGEPDPLCDDGGGRPRAALHEEMSGLVKAFLSESFSE